MPAAPGESLLTTLFADVHYYFNDPASKPLHHRFSRGSYVYVYYNATQHLARLEVANHAGTADQDAFSGYLDAASLRYSYKQPCLCTLTLFDANPQDRSQWHVPSFNERNEQKYLYKIHTVDIYLWTEKDAATFLGHLKAVMGAERQDIRDVPSSARSSSHAEHRDSMSPVVQQLENTAIGTSQYPLNRAGSTTSAQSLPGPPTPATGATASPMQSPPQVAQPAPMAYNPAAPAAPEPIAYREKTPPPHDNGAGTGLKDAAKYDTMPVQFAHEPQQQQAYYSSQNSNQHTPQQAYFGPQATGPQPSGMSIPGLPPPPPPPGGPSPQPHQSYQMTGPSIFPGPPLYQNGQPTSPPPSQQIFPRQTSFGPTTMSTQYAGYPQSGFGPSPGMQPIPGQYPNQPPTPSAPPAYAGHTPLSSPGLPPPPPGQPSQQYAPLQPPVGGYSNYVYTPQHAPGGVQQPQYHQQGGYAGDVHTQVYRPTPAEAAHGHGHHHHHHSPPKPQAPPPPQPGRQDSEGKVRLEDRVNTFEKKVGRYLKGLDKLL